MVSILPNIDSLQLGRSYTHPTAPAAGGQLVRAHHLNSFFKFPLNLLLRQPSHNYCCSGAHRTAAGPAAIIALASSSFPIFDRRDATVPTTRSCLGRHYSFLWRNELVEPPTEFSLLIVSVGGRRKTASQRNS